MKLTYEQICSVAFGAQQVLAQPDGSVYLKRFADAQIDAFGKMNEVYRERAMSGTGCRLDFHTDSRHLRVQIQGPGCYEILVDGLCAQVMKDSQEVTVELPEGDSRVTVMMPDHRPGALQSVDLDADAYVRPHVYDGKFLFLGDSITQGYNSSRPSTSYVNRTGMFFNAQIMNWGVGGTRFEADTLAAVDYDPDVVFIAYGTNDYRHFATMELLEACCAAYMDKVKSLFPEKRIYCLSPIWRADGEEIHGAGNHAQVRSCVIRQCQAHGFTHIDGYGLVPHREEYFADGYLHPNDLGFSLYAENLIRFLNSSR